MYKKVIDWLILGLLFAAALLGSGAASWPVQFGINTIVASFTLYIWRSMNIVKRRRPILGNELFIYLPFTIILAYPFYLAVSDGDWYILPTVIISYTSGFVGYKLAGNKKSAKQNWWILGIYNGIMFVAGFFYIVPSWIMFNANMNYVQKKNEGQSMKGLVFYGKNNARMDVFDGRSKLLVFEFWNERCGSCIRSLQKMRRGMSFIHPSTEHMYLVNTRSSNLHSVAVRELIDKLDGFEYVTSVLDSSRVVCDKLGIQGVPTTVITNGDGKILFSGILSTEPLAYYNFNNILERCRRYEN